MFENHGSHILENQVSAGCFGDFCFALGYQTEHFQLRLHFRPLSSSSATRIVPDKSGLFFVVVCFPLWLLLSAANLLKLPKSQKLQDSYTNIDKKQTQKETQT